MLVLSRLKGETIEIGENIRITIVKITGSHAVQLGIEAPCEVRIVRGELEKHNEKVSE